MKTQSPHAAASQLHHLQFVRGATLRLFKDIATENLCAQPIADCNHVLWIAGHLAGTDDYFLGEFAGIAPVQPKAWQELFGMGSKPVSDTSKYPPLEKLLDAMAARRAVFVQWIQSMSPAELAQPTDEKWHKYAPTIGDTTYFLTWHEGFHCGQLSTLRRAFDMEPAFG